MDFLTRAFSEINVGEEFHYAGHKWLKVSKFSGQRLDNNAVWTIPATIRVTL